MDETELAGKGSPKTIEAILEGGPELPVELRKQQVTSDDYKVKIRYNGGHEHFERNMADSTTPVVFRWTGRTRIAE